MLNRIIVLLTSIHLEFVFDLVYLEPFLSCLNFVAVQPSNASINYSHKHPATRQLCSTIKRCRYLLTIKLQSPTPNQQTALFNHQTLQTSTVAQLQTQTSNQQTAFATIKRRRHLRSINCSHRHTTNRKHCSIIKRHGHLQSINCSHRHQINYT